MPAPCLLVVHFERLPGFLSLELGSKGPHTRPGTLREDGGEIVHLVELPRAAEVYRILLKLFARQAERSQGVEALFRIDAEDVLATALTFKAQLESGLPLSRAAKVLLGAAQEALGGETSAAECTHCLDALELACELNVEGASRLLAKFLLFLSLDGPFDEAERAVYADRAEQAYLQLSSTAPHWVELLELVVLYLHKGLQDEALARWAQALEAAKSLDEAERSETLAAFIESYLLDMPLARATVYAQALVRQLPSAAEELEARHPPVAEWVRQARTAPWLRWVEQHKLLSLTAACAFAMFLTNRTLFVTLVFTVVLVGGVAGLGWRLLRRRAKA